MYNMKKTTLNKELQGRLEIRYEYHGFNGERHVKVPIMYDPDTGFTHDIGDIYDIIGDGDVCSTKRVKVQDK